MAVPRGIFTESSSASRQDPTDKEKWLMKGTDALTHVIEALTLEPCSERVSSDEGFHQICSYSWKNTKPATIYVPGSPNLWSLRSLPFTLRRDVGLFVVDQNAARAPRYPFEPMFQAISLTDPAFRLDDVHLVTNRNSLRNLFDFASGRTGSTFRLDLELVGKTMFFTGKEKNVKRMAGIGRDAGYGHKFERAFTKASNGLADAVCHNRAIQFPLGSLNCIVQFEVDAFCQEPSNSKRVQASETIFGKSPISSSPPEVPVTRTSGGNSAPSYRATKVIKKGEVVASQMLAELKSRTKNSSTGSFMPQLWFGRTPYLLVGIHEDGKVKELHCTDTADLFPEWEEKHQKELQKLVKLITELYGIVMEAAEKKAIAIYKHKAKPIKLHVFSSRATRRVLPSEIIRMNWNDART